MKIPPTLEITSREDNREMHAFFRMLRRIWGQLVTVVNGNIAFGSDVIGSDNIDGVWVKVVFGAANADRNITHNLGRIPVGYIQMRSSVSANVYDGTNNGADWTNTVIVLRCDQATTVWLFIV